MDIAKGFKFGRAMTAQAAGATDVNGDTIDTQGYTGVIIIASFGAIVSGAATSFHLQQGQQSDASDMADLAGTKTTVADTDDNKSGVLCVYLEGNERYVRPVVKRATQNATIDSVDYILFGPMKQPTTNDTDIIGLKTVIAPDEGTP